MARRRLGRAAQKDRDREAWEAADYVYAVARDLGDRTSIRHVELKFPRQIAAPLVFLCEMAAQAVCKHKDWTDRERVDDVALYLLQGLQESLVAMVQSFDEDHFEAWMAAARAQSGTVVE